MQRFKVALLIVTLTLLATTVTAGYYSETRTAIYKPVLFFKQGATSTSSGGVAMMVPFTGVGIAAAISTASGQEANTSLHDPSIIPSALTPLPNSFEVIRQWGGDYDWSTMDVTFWTNLRRGEVIQFEFNSSTPISLELGYGREEIPIIWRTDSSFHGSYRVVKDGAYCFYFTINDSVHQSQDIRVSFRCFEAVNRAAINESLAMSNS